MNIDLNKLLKEVCEAATQIGGYLIDEQSKLKSSSIEMKGSRDYVSYVDREAEKQLVDELKKLVPDAGFLTEEQTVEHVEKDYTWIIDPLDGTSNYVHGLTPYAVSIALQYKNETILGVVYDPVVDEMFAAIKGEKALLNNKTIEVNDKDEMHNSMIGFGIPYYVNKKTQNILENTWKHFGKASFRLNGSAAIEICYVACGRYDAYLHSGLSPWDVAAGAFILQQADGKVTDYSGGSDYIYGKEIVAANSKMHSVIMKDLINLQ